MKKPIFLSITACILLKASFAQTSTNVADKIIGTYWSPKKDAKIEIFKRDDTYYGRSVWTSSPRKDVNNPNESLRTRDLLGVELLKNFKYGDDSYKEGKIYDPGNGKTYDCKITMKGGNLKVRGYVGISLFGRTELFERII